MLLKKEGFPEEGEFVLCSITNIHFHSVFASLDEYGKQGMIHISEVSPGRIRNIRDFVKEGKKVVCLVLRITHDKGHIDLSLRRVNEAQKRNKINEVKQEQLAEKIIEFVAKKLSLDIKELFNKIIEKALKKHHSLYSYFESVITDESTLEDLGLSKDVTKLLDETLKLRIKPPEIEIGGDLKVISYAPDGVETIKSTLIKAENAGKGQTSIVYEGGGRYVIRVKSSDYKDGEKILDKSISIITKGIEESDGEVEFIREER